MCNLRLISRYLELLFFLFSLSSGDVVFAETPSANELVDGWVQRTSGLPNAIIEWESEQTTVAKTLFSLDGPPAMEESNFVRTLKCQFVSDGDRWLWIEEGPRWNSSLRKVVETRFGFLQSSDAYTILDDKVGDGQEDGARIYQQIKGDGPTSVPALAAYFLLMNPFHPRHGQLSGLRYHTPEKTSEEFWGHHACAVLSFEHRTNGPTAKVWLAHDLDWLPVRFQLGDRAEVEFRYDSTSGSDASLPSGWTVKIFNPGSTIVKDSTVASVKRWESPAELPDSSFKLAFPVGTIVWDHRPEHPENYLIRADGTKRPITIDERRQNISPSILLNTEPHYFPLRRSDGSRRIGLVVLGLIGIATLLFGLAKWRSPKSSKS